MNEKLVESSELEPNKEIQLYKFVYRDHKLGGREGKTVFECIAKDIMEADKLYQKETGNNPEKQSYIGCGSFKVEPLELKK